MDAKPQSPGVWTPEQTPNRYKEEIRSRTLFFHLKHYRPDIEAAKASAIAEGWSQALLSPSLEVVLARAVLRVVQG